jgi:hypothetical protein
MPRTYREVRVVRGQSLFDLAIQEYGSVEEVYRLLDDNPEVITVDAELMPGSILKVQERPQLEDERTMNYFRTRNLKVATGETISPGVPGSLGGVYITVGQAQISAGFIRLISNL